ncbi:MAG TPA: hypothetical protein VNQ73_18065 [Ilumatobacter sp.]|nr:hypothetical protein [Ilumatobacter sp.]
MVATDAIGGHGARTLNEEDGKIKMTTLLNDRIESGDVLELVHDDSVISALVLLATDTAIILDACDGSTPFVVKRDELVDYRKFNPAV